MAGLIQQRTAFRLSFLGIGTALAAVVLLGGVAADRTTQPTTQPASERDEVALAGNQPGQMTVEVYERENGKPVAEAGVQAISGRGLRNTVFTDEHGRAQVRAELKPTGRSFTVRVTKPGFAPMVVAWRRPHETAALVVPPVCRVPLGPTRPIGGVVKNDEGQPIDGARVQ